MGRLIGPIALYVLIGVPLVAYVWETLNVFTGQVEPRRPTTIRRGAWVAF